MKVCHVTNAHDSDDFRIFTSECCSLADAGYDVFLVAQGDSREDKGVHVIGVGQKPESRRERMTTFAKKVFEASLKLDCDVYHLHDPELMRFVPKYVKRNKKVIFDSHEDNKYLMLAKPWIPKWLRGFASSIFGIYEHYICRHLDGYLACYHWTYDRVKKWCPNIQLVFNFPKWKPYISRDCVDEKTFCYAGGISAQWMHHNVISAISEVSEARYLLAGNISGDYGDKLRKADAWSCVDWVGRLRHEDLPEKMYAKSAAGIALLDYIPQCMGHKGNLSNTKLFEYMVNGLPVICTDFDLWKEVIEKYKCGICVDPHNIECIKNAIRWIIEHPQEAKEMGKRGNEAIKAEYNWDANAVGLFKVYKEIENRTVKI